MLLWGAKIGSFITKIIILQNGRIVPMAMIYLFICFYIKYQSLVISSSFSYFSIKNLAYLEKKEDAKIFVRHSCLNQDALWGHWCFQMNGSQK